MSYTLDQDGNEIQEILNKAASAIEEGTQEEHESPSGVEKLARLDRLVDSPFANKGFKNHIINGNFDVWQRGTSFDTTGGNYCADRWRLGGALPTQGTLLVTRQTFPLGQTDVPNNPRYFLNWSQTVASTTGHWFEQRIEGVRNFAGQTLTISFYARLNSGTFPFVLDLVQNFGTGGSPSPQVTTTVEPDGTLTDQWAKYTYTVAIPGISGKTLGTDGNDYLGLRFTTPVSGVWNVDFAQFQIEAGPIATPFEQRPVGMELALCQRYFWILAPGNGVGIASGFIYSPTEARYGILFPHQFRVAPAITYTGSWVAGHAPTNRLLDSLNFANITNNSAYITGARASGNMIEGNGSFLYTNDGGTIIFDAEL